MRRAARRLWPLAAAVAAACGFAPQDDFTGRRIGDGVGPWRDLGVLGLCLGLERVGPPASEPRGLCGRTSAAEPPCLGDDDCGSRESCVCGRCTVAYCSSASDCPAGRVCSFTDNRCDVPCFSGADCASGEQCFSGACRGRCNGDEDCQVGELCGSLGRCTVVDCGDDDACLTGEVCKIQRVPRMAAEPTVLARERPGEPPYTMWLEMSDEVSQTRFAIYRATSDDGIRFRVDPAAPVIDDGGEAHAPALLRATDGYVLYYQVGAGDELRAASSPDGIDFGPAVQVLAGGAGAAAVRAPGAVSLPDGRVGLYYERGDGAAIALAVGPPLGPLADRGVVLSPADVEDPQAAGSTQFWVDVEALHSPSAILADTEAGPVIRLYFTGFGQESGDSTQFGETVPIPANFSVGYGVTDPERPGEVELWPYNPVFDRVSVFLDHHGELGPAAVQATGRDGAPREAYLLYFLDGAGDASSVQGLAVVGNGEVGE